jgi:hypothetical protein
MSTDFTLRKDVYGCKVHYFRKRDLADPDIEWLIPWCSEDAMYPQRIPHDEVTIEGVGDSIPCGLCLYRDLENE